MPTERHHGGAALMHIPLNVPGFRGLNTESSAALLTPDWATRLEETVIDENNRVAARKGFDLITTTPEAAHFVRLFEYSTRAGVVELIASTATTFLRSTNNGVTWTNITGTAVFTDGNWDFHNFNDKVVAFQDGKAPVVYAGTAFAPIADVNAPTGSTGLSAFGRLWAVDDDGTTLSYCSLLDETDWTSSDAGYLDLFNTWPGADSVVGLAAFNGALVVFGERNIIFFTDGQGSALGLNPLAAYVSDTFAGAGCVARDSIQQVDGDLWFLSRVGLISLGRLISERSNPIENLSKNIQTLLLQATFAAPVGSIQSVYSPVDKLYLLSFPTATGGQTFAFDTRGRLEDGTVRCSGIWRSMVPRAMCRRRSEVLLFTLDTTQGQLGAYRGYTQPGTQYSFVWESGWVDLDAGGYLKFIKRFGAVFFMDRTADVTFNWAYDFNPIFFSQTVQFQDVSGDLSEYGVAEFGEDLFGGGLSLQTAQVPGSSAGEYIKLGLRARINNSAFSVQNAELFAKIGRLS